MSYETARLGDFVTFSNGRSSPERTGSGEFAVFGSNGPIGRSGDCNAPPLTTVIGRVGSYCGSVHFSKHSSWVTDNAIKAIANEQDEGRFWYYALLVADLGRLRSGSGQPLINQRSLNTVELPVPPRCDRLRIADILGSLDDKIELNRRMNETLEAMAQAIFRDWFVDFGPTRRKLEGATDPLTIMGGLVQDTERAKTLADLFPAALADDGLPAGWRLGVASALVEFNPKEPLKKGTPAPYSDMSSLPTSGPLADPPVEREYGSGMRFRNGDALLARITPCLENGKSAFVDFLPDAQTVGWGSTEFYVLRSRKGVPTPFAYLLVRHPEFRAAAIASMTGTSGRQRAQVDRLEAFPFAEPRMELLGEFGRFVLPMFHKITANGGENRTLAVTRDLLLPKLMSGEIRLSEAEDLLEAAQ
ncbi:restriction endonuclease subunit S [Sinorhizobium meliloti]|uniref:restriction endonuclease subunit S n=1 Tax=Rhizobium meliloti TaxID=382 RepID=UPI00299D520B|nr:restriction endonuclease subunit S [Sinorhizobium meliloti]